MTTAWLTARPTPAAPPDAVMPFVEHGQDHHVADVLEQRPCGRRHAIGAGANHDGASPRQLTPAPARTRPARHCLAHALHVIADDNDPTLTVIPAR